jgi:trimeric autotransporter adhesin
MRLSFRLLPLFAAATLLTGVSLEAQSPMLLRLRNAAAVDRLVVDSAGGLAVSGADGSGGIPASGPGTRMMWYPGKAAFRAGSVTGLEWDHANVGPYSIATGYTTTASGAVSTASGYGTNATGSASTAMGSSTTASGQYSTATGWWSRASGLAATAMGNSTTASGHASTAMGGSTTASQEGSTAMGWHTTASGQYSTAMGRYASTNGMSGAFVYGDWSTVNVLNASAQNEVSFRAAGGFRLFTTNTMTTGAVLHPGQASWSTLSDRNRKAALLHVEGEEILTRIRDVPVSTWIYADQPDASVRHIGPMAQDWHAAFGFSADSLTINSGDFDGVNLAAVQALTTRTDLLRNADAEQAQRIRSLEEEKASLLAAVSALQARNARLEARLERLERAAGPTP